ncbi:uncharacterized protein A1O9_13000 [Exophiala aquamarina CBS 119918]|uniref:Alpha/beta hydrolase fold-3 domain-containing protein n=1 Tax=Exophiala aquamarina CBS 119918 TaxID=1182545 RepID=A0A072NV57_9EURO|nr:uncharacterized protein A1O9_13000 [Exophiala aquamarina CBS 119918]KEF50938.1 hypothetical protein A1O9_13000 [Exophiala aquamarina CBS 119918]
MKEWGPILFQVLLVPITDNTATTSTNDCWKKFEKAPGLSAEKMLFYRELYLQNADTLHWEVSPLFASPEQFQKLPPALIVVAEVDILQSDGRRYAAKMEDYGVEAEVVVMKRLPHAALTLGGVLGEVEGFVQRICGAVRKAFDTRTSQIDSLPASHNTQIDR